MLLMFFFTISFIIFGPSEGQDSLKLSKSVILMDPRNIGNVRVEREVKGDEEVEQGELKSPIDIDSLSVPGKKLKSEDPNPSDSSGKLDSLKSIGELVRFLGTQPPERSFPDGERTQFRGSDQIGRRGRLKGTIPLAENNPNLRRRPYRRRDGFRKQNDGPIDGAFPFQRQNFSRELFNRSGRNYSDELFYRRRSPSGEPVPIGRLRPPNGPFQKAENGGLEREGIYDGRRQYGGNRSYDRPPLFGERNLRRRPSQFGGRNHPGELKEFGAQNRSAELPTFDKLNRLSELLNIDERNHPGERETIDKENSPGRLPTNDQKNLPGEPEPAGEQNQSDQLHTIDHKRPPFELVNIDGQNHTRELVKNDRQYRVGELEDIERKNLSGEIPKINEPSPPKTEGRNPISEMTNIDRQNHLKQKKNQGQNHTVSKSASGGLFSIFGQRIGQLIGNGGQQQPQKAVTSKIIDPSEKQLQMKGVETEYDEHVQLGKRIDINIPVPIDKLEQSNIEKPDDEPITGEEIKPPGGPLTPDEHNPFAEWGKVDITDPLGKAVLFESQNLPDEKDMFGGIKSIPELEQYLGQKLPKEVIDIDGLFGEALQSEVAVPSANLSNYKLDDVPRSEPPASSYRFSEPVNFEEKRDLFPQRKSAEPSRFARQYRRRRPDDFVNEYRNGGPYRREGPYRYGRRRMPNRLLDRLRKNNFDNGQDQISGQPLFRRTFAPRDQYINKKENIVPNKFAERNQIFIQGQGKADGPSQSAENRPPVAMRQQDSEEEYTEIEPQKNRRKRVVLIIPVPKGKGDQMNSYEGVMKFLSDLFPKVFQI